MAAKPNIITIPNFEGIQQQFDGNMLPLSSARDARNVDTSDGDLRVAAGYTALYENKVPTEDKILRLVPIRGKGDFLVVTTNNIYSEVGGVWTSVHKFEKTLTTKQISYLQMQINSVEYVLIATGETRIVKVRTDTREADDFGTAAYSWEGTVLEYDADSYTVRLDSVLTDEQVRHIIVDGLFVGTANYKVSKATVGSEKVKLAKKPDDAIDAGASAHIRGGGSTASVNFLGKYYQRLIAAGDPEAPCRVYWSAVAGDGRTPEDWLAVTGSADASGGYVEVGVDGGDKVIGLCCMTNYVLIFKEYSTWRLYGDRPSNFTLECLDQNAEIMSNSGVTANFSTPYWMTKTGLKSANYNSAGSADNGVKYLREFLEEVNDFDTSKAAVSDNKLYFTCHVDSEKEYDDHIIIYNLVTGSILIRDGFEIADICTLNGLPYIVDGNRLLCRFEDGDSYNGEPIVAYWKGQPTDFGVRYIVKQIKEIFMRCEEDSDMDIFFYCDDNQYGKPVKFFAKHSGFFSLPVFIDQARVVQFEFRNRNGSMFHIKGGIDIKFEREMTP